MRRRLPETAATTWCRSGPTALNRVALPVASMAALRSMQVDRLLVHLDLVHPAQLIDEPAQAEFFDVDFGHEVSIHRESIVSNCKAAVLAAASGYSRRIVVHSILVDNRATHG